MRNDDRHEHLTGSGDVSGASPELGRGASMGAGRCSPRVAAAIRGGASPPHGMQRREIAKRKGR